MLSKTFMLLMKWTTLEKNVSQNYLFGTMVRQRGSIKFISFILRSFVQAKFVTSQIPHSSLSTTVFPKFLTDFFRSFLKNVGPKKHGITKLISINQYCQTSQYCHTSQYCLSCYFTCNISLETSNFAINEIMLWQNTIFRN